MIRINNDYVISVDPYNYTLMRDRHKVDKNGNPVFDTVGYYSSMESALNALLDENIKNRVGCDMTLKEAIEVIKKTKEEFYALIERCLE